MACTTFPSREGKVRRDHHPDDEYHDALVISSKGAKVIDTKIVTRWKESGLSGDEWRITIVADIEGPIGVSEVVRLRYSTFRDLFLRLPGHAIETVPQFTLLGGPADAEIFRKGHLLYKHSFHSVLEAVAGIWNRYTIDAEVGKDYQLTEAEERQHCQQPGCSAVPTVLYRVKKLHCQRCSFVEDPTLFLGTPHTWFCGEHSGRGDCGMHDSDSNYEAVGLDLG